LPAMKRLTLLPELRGLVTASSVEFRAAVLTALALMDPGTDYSVHLLPLFKNASHQTRMTVVIAARHFPFKSVGPALLDVVRNDGSFLVRYHAAESLLELGDVYPRELASHKELFKDLADASDVSKAQLLGNMLGSAAPPTAEQRSRHARAAETLRRLIAERAAQGKCSPLTPVGVGKGHLSTMDGHIVALAIDAAESSCERELAFLIFIGSQHRGLGPDVVQDIPGFIENDLTVMLPTVSGDLEIEYRAAAGVLRVGKVELKRSAGNVAVFASTPQGLVLRYTGTANLRFPRDADAARTLLARSNDIRSHLP